MARQRVDPIFAALARARPALTSAHFGLSYSDRQASTPSIEPRASRESVDAREPGQSAAALTPGQSADALAPGQIADARAADAPVPAPRVGRTVCRLGFSVPKRHLARAVDRNALKRVAREAWRHARWGSIRRPGAAMLKLRRPEAQWKSTPRGALKKAWRLELDALFERLIARMRAEQRGAPDPRGGGGPRSSEAAPVSPTYQPNRSSP